MLGGIEFRAVGRKDDEPQVAGDVELGRAMPGGAIKNHESDDVWWNGNSEVVEIELHGLDVSQRQDERVGRTGLRMNGSKDVAPLVATAAGSNRALTDGRPDAAVAGLQVEACFILETQPDALVRVVSTQLRQDIKRFFEK